MRSKLFPECLGSLDLAAFCFSEFSTFELLANDGPEPTTTEW